MRRASNWLAEAALANALAVVDSWRKRVGINPAHTPSLHSAIKVAAVLGATDAEIARLAGCSIDEVAELVADALAQHLHDDDVPDVEARGGVGDSLSPTSPRAARVGVS